MNIIIALLVLSAIIIIHEFGHFLLAKANGVGVTEFAVGMGPRIVQFKKGETVYCIKILPFGGSCMMVGEDEDSTDEKAFNNKSVWARISIIAAGPVFNFILAFVMAVIIIANIGYDPCIINNVEAGSAADEAGLKAGDLVVKINGKKVLFGRQLQIYDYTAPEKELSLTVERDGELLNIALKPNYVEHDYFQVGVVIKNLEITDVTEGKPGFLAGLRAGDIIKAIDGTAMEDSSMAVAAITASAGNSIVITVERNGELMDFSVAPAAVHTAGYEKGLEVNTARTKITAWQTFCYSFAEVRYWIDSVFDSLKMIFQGRVTKDDVSGPVGVVSLIGEVVEESRQDGIFYIFLNIFNMILMLSANLGVMNLLPLPALDGGRLVFLIIEAVRRKPVPREKEGMVHFVGIVVLMLLMVFITFNDIMKLF